MKNNVYLVIRAICLVVTFAGCVPTIKKENLNCQSILEKNKENKTYKNIYLVLVDFTTSTDTTIIKSNKEKVISIIERIPNLSKLQVYPIIDEINQTPIIDYVKHLGGKNNGERTFSKTLDTCLINNLKQKIINYSSFKEYRNTDPLSCISRAMRFADTQFRTLGNRDTTNFNFNLIILSDMIEECNNSAFNRPLLMQKQRQKEAFSIIENNPIYTDLSYVNLSVVLSSKQTGFKNTKFLSVSQLEKAWTTIFKKFNIRAFQIKNLIPFSTSVPQKI
jgi:hypothetical protein